MSEKLTEAEREEKLKKVLFDEEQAARNWQDGDLTSLRTESLNFYDRGPTGDEVDGQSKVVTSEFLDTVESMMPTLVRAFISSEKIVEFTPDNPGDEQFAKEATDFIPHVIMRQNDGFTILHAFIKDALMYRLSWLAVDIDEDEKVSSTTVENLPSDQWAIMRARIEQKAEEQKADVEYAVEPDDADLPEAPTEPPVMTPGALHSLLPSPATFSGTVKVTRKIKQVVIENIAPEDGLATPTARHIDGASMAGYRKKTTASELRTLGLDQDEIDELSGYYSPSPEATDRQPDALLNNDTRSNKDDSERQLWIVVAFVKFDWNGDGISEMRRVVYANAGSTNAGAPSAIIENEEWTDGIAPIVPGSPILMSHTIEGRSIFDLVRDLQNIGTAVSRGLLDNTYAVNRPRPAVSDKVDLASLIDWTPGMPVRFRQGAGPTPDNLSWLQVPSIAADALQVLQWQDKVKQQRTGVTPNNQGMGDEQMNPTATGASILTSAADERTGLIVRVLAETAFKRLYRLVYRAVKRSAQGPTQFWQGALDAPQAGAQNWQTVDPTKWPDDMSLSVDVGLAASNKYQQIQNIQLVGQGQQALLQSPGGPMLVKPEHAANTFRKLVEATGFKNTGQFVATSEEIKAGEAKQAAQPPPPSPEMAKAQAHIQASQQKNQADMQLAQAKHAADQQAEQQKAQSDLQIAQQKLEGQLAIQREEMQGKLEIARQQMQMDDALKRQELAEEMRLKELEIRLRGTATGGVNTEVREQTVTQ